LRVAHDVPDYWSAFVTEPHIIVVLVPKIRATAFAGRYKNQIDFRMWHRGRALPLVLTVATSYDELLYQIQTVFSVLP
jgi:hypothetical protein